MPARRAHTQWHPAEQLEPRHMLATISWDGGAGTTSWHDAANWSTDTLPGAADDVIIDDIGSITIEYTQAIPTLVQSILNSEGLAISAGKISTSGLFQQNGPMVMSGGQIAGDGDLLLRAGLQWSGGSMSGAGRTFVVAPSGQVVVTGDVTLSRTLFNDATFTWQSGNIKLVGGTLVNRPTGTFNAQSPGFISSGAGTNLFANNGTLRRNGTSATTTTFDARFTNSGTVQVIQGGLRIRGGGTAFGGAFTVNGFTTITFANNSYVFQAPATLGGGGTHIFNSGTHTFAGPFNAVGSLRVQGASLKLTGGERPASEVILSAGILTLGGPLAVTGSMTWSGGELRGPANLRIPASSTVTISGASEKVARNITIEIAASGLVVWSGGRLNLDNSTIQNAGEFRALGDRIRALNNAASIENTGLFVKDSGLGLILSNAFGGVAFNNSSTGELEIRSGALTLLGGGLSTGTITGSQTSALIFGAITFTIAAGTVTGIPSIEVSGPVTWNGGAIMGPGQLIVSPNAHLLMASGAQKVLGRTLTNNGILTWSNGLLQLDASTITNSQGATFNLGAANGLSFINGPSTINNQGLFIKTGSGVISFENSGVFFNNTGILRVKGTLKLDGTKVQQINGGTLSAGTWVMLNGGRLELIGSTILVNNGKITLSGPGATIVGLQLLTRNNGTLTISGAAVPLTSNGNQFTNAGILNINDGGLLSISGKVIFTPTSRFNLTITSSTVFGRLTATGSLELDGTVSGSFLFTPPAGSTLQFLAGSLRTGEFMAEVITGLPGGGEVQYLAQGARWRVF